MRKQTIFAMTLLETMISIALFSLVMLAASQAVIRGMAIWSVTAQETAASWTLQQGMNTCFMDLLKSKTLAAPPTQIVTTTEIKDAASNVIDYVDNKLFTAIKLQVPVNYTSKGADGQVGYYVIYEVRTLDGEYTLFRDLYSGSDVLQNSRMLIRGIDSTTLDTKIDDPDYGPITGFRVIRKADTKEFTIYLRLAKSTDSVSNKKRELISKVFIRNLD